ncbi:MAG: hypothetical protein LC108_11550, partial [Anaerolineales bacterium]|nr:hypothetical protein [Anaerolineales bacterium]
MTSHLGSISLITDSTGAIISDMKYREASHKDKACPLTSFGMLCEGEVRYSSGAEQTKYAYTGHYSYTSDFGLMFYREASRAVFWRVDN